jgi:hypothetical protein
MAFTRLRFPHILPLALLAGVALVPAGCGNQEGVTKTTVPKETEAPKSEDYRLLGGMFPAEHPGWFFKYNGPIAEVSKYEADFDKLLASVKLNGDAPLEFTPPEGWERGPGRDGFVKVFATVKTKDGKQEVSITQSAGGAGPNLDRWVGLIGLKPGIDDMKKYTKVIEAKGVKGLKVDLKGPNDPSTKRGPMPPH